MKAFRLSAILFLSLSIGASVASDTPQEKYISKYAVVAVREMYRSGVPASITLAQGLLESRSGLSPLATEGNNHFGIKCHDWKGRHINHDDDLKGECFRAYDSPEESFRDHSDFLRYRDRYKPLFENKTTDYKSWAYGLKKAGYATDPSYPSKLIKLIEDYELWKYDTMKSSDFPPGGETASPGAIPVEEGTRVTEEPEEVLLGDSDRQERRVKIKRRHAKKEKGNVQPVVEAAVDEVIPESPLSIEEDRPVEEGAREEFHFPLSRQMYFRNGVPFIYSIEGETYASIAKDYKLFLKELLRYNDLSSSVELLPGTVVYVQPKKNQAPKGLDKYIADSAGENLRDICQRFAVKMSAIRKLNGFGPDYVPGEGDTILLRDDPFFSRMLGRNKKQ